MAAKSAPAHENKSANNSNRATLPRAPEINFFNRPERENQAL
jgi:hypothetical protein